MILQRNKTRITRPSFQHSPSPAPQSDRPPSGPLFFGHEDRPLFGWLHAATEPVRADLGLLVCNPFGNEAICAHRTVRHLCEQASRAGIATLRFDYDGTGDSAGHDADPRRLEAWLESIQLAADELKRSAGVERLCLLGIRLGATLAAVAASRRDDCVGLVTFAPVVTGKAYLRELRLLQRAIDAKRDVTRAASDGTQEAAGFVLSVETQATLGALNLNELERPPAPALLVLDRAELPGDNRWAERLGERGARVERMCVTGYTEMMLDSHENVVPQEAIRSALGWLTGLARPAGTSTIEHSGTHSTAASIDALLEASRQHTSLTRTPPYAAPGDPAATIQESTLRLGQNGALFGIVSEPHEGTGAAAPGRAKAVLLLNSGAVHHIGPNRLYVTLARHLAQRGYTVLRMDIGGLGDSSPRSGEPENVVYSKHALQDIRAGLEFLQSRPNIQEVHAVGLCSGAYNAFKAAVAGLPLAGVVLINPLTFFWKEGMSLQFPEFRIAADIMRYRENAFRLGPWLKLLRGQVDLRELAQVLARRAWGLARIQLRSVARLLHLPLHDDLPSELIAISRAGIRPRFVFADRDPGQELLDVLGGRVAKRLRARGLLSIQTIAGADHTFTDHSCRTMLLAALDGALSDST